VSQKTYHVWFAIIFDTCERILTFLAEMLPMEQAIKRHFTMANQITCAFALPGKTGKRENYILPQMLY